VVTRKVMGCLASEVAGGCREGVALPGSKRDGGLDVGKSVTKVGVKGGT
jgi:hypothetical protein